MCTDARLHCVTGAEPRSLFASECRKAKHFCFARLHCVDKPDSVVDSHISGIAVTDDLKRLFQHHFYTSQYLRCGASFLTLWR